MHSHLNIHDRSFRYYLGAFLIAAVVLVEQSPAWLALLATYPVFTAMLEWDPVYALYFAVIGKYASPVRPMEEVFVSS